MHLSDADLAAALDPSGGGPSGDAARAHAATCEACMSAIATAQTADREVGDLLRLLDHAAPAPDMTFREARTLDFERARSVGTIERGSLTRNRRLPGAQRRPAASESDAARSQRSTLAIAGVSALMSSIIGVAAYLKQSPLPSGAVDRGS